MKTPLLVAEFEPPRFWPPIFLQPAEPPPIIAPMTVGIGAICEGGKAIVMAADRLVLVPEAGSLAMEMDNKKLMQLAPQVWLAITGTIQDSEYVQERFRHAANLLALQSVHQIAKRLRKSCEQIRARQVEERIIRPILGVSGKEFRETCLKTGTTPIALDVLNKIIAYSFQLELLIAGIDDSGAHLYRVTHSQINSHEGVGFTAIGIGESLAATTLAGPRHSFVNRSLPETVYRVYEAKRAAEKTNLVEKTTDILLLRQGIEASFVKPEHIDVLRRIYRKRQPPSLSEDEVAAIKEILPTPTQPPAQSAP